MHHCCYIRHESPGLLCWVPGMAPNMIDIASLPDTLGDPALIQSLNAYYMGSMFDRCVSNSDAKWRVKRPACCMVSISLAGSMSDAFVLGMCRSCLQ